MARITTKMLLERELSRRGITQTELAKILGVSGPYINQILHGKRGDSSASLIEFAEKLGVDPFQKEDFPARVYGPIPVISWVHAGAFHECIDSWPVGVSGEGEPVFSKKNVSPNAFGLRVTGDSMSPRYLDGDIIIIDPSLSHENGEPCVVWLNGEVVFRMIKETDLEIELVPMNDKYPNTVIKKGGRVDFRVIGKVVDMIPKL